MWSAAPIIARARRMEWRDKRPAAPSPGPDFLAFAAEVCPNAESPASEIEWQHDLETLPVSTWAHKHLGFEPTPKQAEVLDSPSRNVILCCHRKWGKTTVSALKAFHYLMSAPNRSIAILAPSMDQGGFIIANIVVAANTLGVKYRRYLGRRHSLLFPNGSRIFALPHNTSTSLGSEADVLMVDEAAKVSDDVLWAVQPSTSRKAAGLWMLSTPLRQTGFFARIWHDQKQNVHRILSPVSDTPSINQEFLETFRRASPTRYAQDFECEFIKPDRQLCDVSVFRRLPRAPSGPLKP
jgi:hypothetical protein